MRTALAEPRLTTSALSLRYDDRLVVPDLDLELPTGDFTVIVGPNACGKSTTLRALARIMRPDGGAVLLDGTSIKNIPTKELARTLGLLRSPRSRPRRSRCATWSAAAGIRIRVSCGSGRTPTSAPSGTRWMRPG